MKTNDDQNSTTETTDVLEYSKNNINNDNTRNTFAESTQITIKNKIKIKNENPMTTREILYELLSISLPSMLFFFCLFIQQSIILVFINKIKNINNQEAISGIGIANLYLNVTLISVAIGLISGFNVLAGNAYGKKKFYLFGIYFHRCILISYLFSITMIIIHFFTLRYGLNLFGATGESLEISESYAKISMFYVLFEILFNSSYRYLNMAKKGYITIIVLIVTTLLHILWCQIIMINLDFKVNGAAICLLFSQFLTGSSLIGYIIIRKPIKNTIFCLNSDSFKSWGPYLSLSIPACLLMCLEWWAYEFQQVIVANCGRYDWKEQLNIHVLSANIYTLLKSVNIGINISSTITSSKYVAMNKIKELKKTAYYNVLFGVIVQSILFTFVYIYRFQALKIFTNNHSIIEKGGYVLPYLSLVIFLDAIKSSLQGIIIGLRKQIFASSVSFDAFYLIILSMSYYLTITCKMGALGVWIAATIGYSIIILVYISYLFFINLNESVRFTLKKIKEDERVLDKIAEKDEKESTYTQSTNDLFLSGKNDLNNIENDDSDCYKKSDIIHSENEIETAFDI